MIEPRLQEVLNAAKKLSVVRNSRTHFCANSYWSAHLGRKSFKEVLEVLFGHKPEAFKAACEYIYYYLPDCKACFCPLVGLIPKNKRLIKITTLLKELKKAASWHQEHLEDFDQLYKEAQPIFEKLESLGVPKTFSESVFVFGPDITPGLVLQFQEGNDVKQAGN